METLSRLETEKGVGGLDQSSAASVTSAECNEYEDEPEVMWTSYVIMAAYAMMEWHAVVLSFYNKTPVSNFTHEILGTRSNKCMLLQYC
jgi:hypothetical protein